MKRIAIALIMISALSCAKKKALKEGTLTNLPNPTGESWKLEAYVPVEETNPKSLDNPKGFILSIFADTTHPEIAILRLVSNTNSTLKAECNQLQLWVGAQELKMGFVAHDKSVVVNGSTVFHLDTFLRVLSAEDLQRLSTAEAIKGNACGATFSLNASQLDKAKKLSSQLKPTTQPSNIQ